MTSTKIFFVLAFSAIEIFAFHTCQHYPIENSPEYLDEDYESQFSHEFITRRELSELLLRILSSLPQGNSPKLPQEEYYSSSEEELSKHFPYLVDSQNEKERTREVTPIVRTFDGSFRAVDGNAEISENETYVSEHQKIEIGNTLRIFKKDQSSETSSTYEPEVQTEEPLEMESYPQEEEQPSTEQYQMEEETAEGNAAEIKNYEIVSNKRENKMEEYFNQDHKASERKFESGLILKEHAKDGTELSDAVQQFTTEDVRQVATTAGLNEKSVVFAQSTERSEALRTLPDDRLYTTTSVPGVLKTSTGIISPTEKPLFNSFLLATIPSETSTLAGSLEAPIENADGPEVKEKQSRSLASLASVSRRKKKSLNIPPYNSPNRVFTKHAPMNVVKGSFVKFPW